MCSICAWMALQLGHAILIYMGAGKVHYGQGISRITGEYAAFWQARRFLFSSSAGHDGELWVFNPADESAGWTRRSFVGPRPPARSSTGFAAASAAGALFLFGGSDSAGTCLLFTVNVRQLFARSRTCSRDLAPESRSKGLTHPISDILQAHTLSSIQNFDWTVHACVQEGSAIIVSYFIGWKVLYHHSDGIKVT